MKTKLRVVYLNVEEKKAPVEQIIDDNIYTFYEMIQCDAFDICKRNIGEREYRIICDDVGFFKSFPKISAVASEFGLMPLVGNLIVCGIEDKYGNLTDLTDEDVQNILQNVAYIDGRFILINVN